MKKVSIIVLGLAVFALAAMAQTSTSTSGSGAASAQAGNAQVSGSANTGTGATAGQSGATVNSNSSASGQAATSPSSGEQPEGDKGASPGRRSPKESAGKGSKGEANKDEGTKNEASSELASGTTINAELSKSLDAKKLKQGDPVVAKVTENVRSEGKVVLKRGTKLMGHVTEAQAKAKGASQSAIGIAFDQAVAKGGEQIPLHAVIQAMAAPQINTAMPAGGDQEGGMGAPSPMGAPAPSGGGGLGGPIGGVAGAAGNVGSAAGNTVGGLGNTVGSAAGDAGGAAGRVATTANGELAANSQGVAGIPGATLNSAANTMTEGSVVTSNGKDLHIDSGTQLLLRVTQQ